MLGETSWQSRDTNLGDVKTSSRPQIVDHFFYSRGLNSEEKIQAFLNHKLKDLTNPLKIKDMSKAVDRLLRARLNNEKILIYGDYDMDGSPGLAMGLMVFKRMGFDVRGFQPDRHQEGYGFHFEPLKKYIDEGVTLILTVDVGITDVETVKKFNQQNIDVVLTDHHQLSELGLPPAVAVVNPNRPDDESGLNYLCGTGVMFYLLMALKKTLKEKDLIENDFDLKEYLDLFAIATLTDMVPLVKDNRILVNHGLEQLAKTTKAGLAELLKSLELSGKKLSSQEVAIRFTPKLNALTRMDADIKPIDILMMQDKVKAPALIESVVSIHKSRVDVQAEAEIILNLEMEKQKDNGFFYLSHPEIHKGIMGLLATKVTEKLKIPAFVGSIEGQTIYGSSRMPREYEGSVLEALRESQSTLTKFGGHHAAAGFELITENSEAFSRALKKYFSENQKKVKNNFYDLKVSFFELSEFMSYWDHLEPFGEGWNVPVFRINSASVEQVKWMKEKHLKLSLRQPGYPMVLEAVLFNAPDIYKNIRPQQKINLIVEPGWNFYMGSKRLQLMVKEIAAI